MAVRKITLTVNGKPREFEGDPEQPLLWYLRDGLYLTGTKYACGAGSCGACTVHIEGEAVRSCTLAMKLIAGQSVVTIEGLATGTRLHPVQQAWIEEDVAQCGYCQTGQIMAAVALLRRVAKPTDADIASFMNLCRCGTYPRARRAIFKAAKRMGIAA
ncbi:(2Fe-2S)-binding protein [Usitatibacter palustris]|uniref:Isoquinoline 1-oxidoreductase subunit alpha n=1 Tax=Usitatibacter palustris TaxID=2732487 RepID=A0A6M4H7W4_9PROT|nr:(2Fe-2S)-binding protein [Usitatibacter palustris]QJR15749.1 Isoquinoline 1-oxidoreductase subunit alpha [Usitatibacter palustris]